MCEWRSALNPDYHCRVSPEPGSDYCIFHEPGEKDIERFKQAFYSQIREEGPPDERNAQYDFRGYVFPTGLTVQGEEAELILPREISGALIMAESTIKGCADFEHATFKGDASFDGATFAGDVSFDGAVFNMLASFDGATFNVPTFFDGTTFKGNASFDSATFEGDAFFRDTTFKGNASFDNATFEGGASFSDFVFRRDVSFETCTSFEADASFDNATFEDVACFGAIVFKGLAFFWNATFRWDAFFSDATFKDDAVFRHSMFKGTADFDGATFEEGTDFGGAKATALFLGQHRPTVSWWEKNRQGVTLTDWPTGHLFWKFARITFANAGSREEADAAHYFERIWRWRGLRHLSLKETGKTRWAKWFHVVLDLLGINLILSLVGIDLTEPRLERLRRALLWSVYGIMSGLDCLLLRCPTAYGASLSRLFVTWGLLIGGFAAVYHLVGVRIFASASSGLAWPLSFGRALYFSIITFTTLGYGDIKPTPGWGSALTATEAILGGIMMALTVLVIGRKFMR